MRWIAAVLGTGILLALFVAVLRYIPPGQKRLPIIVFVVVAVATTVIVALFRKAR